MELTEITIRLRQGAEKPEIIMDGRDITEKVMGFNISAEPGIPPLVTLAFRADLDADLDALVKSHQSTGETIEKLRAINAEELESEVLADLGMDDRMVPVLLQAIIDRVSG